MNLRAHVGLGPALKPDLLALAETDHREETHPERGSQFRGHEFVGLPEVLSALTVAQDAAANSELLELLGADRAGERSGLLMGEILTAHPHHASLQDLHDGRQERERGTDHDFRAGVDSGQLPFEIAGQAEAFGEAQIHFPVPDDQRASHDEPPSRCRRTLSNGRRAHVG